MIPPPYDERFSGDATYYGVTPDGDGNCAIGSPLPAMYDGMIPVALNNDQYGDSSMCGACIEGEGSGEGEGADPVEGPFKAYITDRLVTVEIVCRWVRRRRSFMRFFLRTDSCEAFFKRWLDCSFSCASQLEEHLFFVGVLLVVKSDSQTGVPCALDC